MMRTAIAAVVMMEAGVGGVEEGAMPAEEEETINADNSQHQSLPTPCLREQVIGVLTGSLEKEGWMEMVM